MVFVSSTPGNIVSSAVGAVPALTGTGLDQAGNGDTVSSISLLPASGNGLPIGETTSFDNNVSSAQTSEADAYVSATAVFFKLGTLVNSDSDTDAEYVVLEFNALVLNDTDSNVGERVRRPGRFATAQ